MPIDICFQAIVYKQTLQQTTIFNTIIVCDMAITESYNDTVNTDILRININIRLGIIRHIEQIIMWREYYQRFAGPSFAIGQSLSTW